MHDTICIMHHASCIMNHASYIMHRILCIFHQASYEVTEYNAMKFDVMKCKVMKYDVMRYDVMKYDVIKHDVMKMKETLFWRLCPARANTTLVVLVPIYKWLKYALDLMILYGWEVDEIKAIFSTYMTDIWLKLSKYTIICTECCLYLTNISAIYQQNQHHISVISIWVKSKNVEPTTPHFKIVYIFNCWLFYFWRWSSSYFVKFFYGSP